MTGVIENYRHYEAIDVVIFKMGDQDYKMRYNKWLSFMRWMNYMDGIIKETLES